MKKILIALVKFYRKYISPMETNLVDDLGADSLDVVELIMSVEDEFGIVINDDSAANLLTVRQIVDFIEKMQ